MVSQNIQTVFLKVCCLNKGRKTTEQQQSFYVFYFWSFSLSNTYIDSSFIFNTDIPASVCIYWEMGGFGYREYLTGHFLSYLFPFGVCRTGLSIWTPDIIIKASPICFHVLNKLALILGQYCGNKLWHKS